MVKVGVTGGIGSGKTTLCREFEKHGAYVLNADDLAKKIMVEDPQVKENIISTFGRQSYTNDGSLNTEYLAAQAFGQGRVKELNDIVHPEIPKAAQVVMAEAAEKGYDVFVYEAALLLQNLRPKELDHVVLVLADEENRIKRVQQRDRVARESVLDRMEKQQDFTSLKHLADIVVYNNGTLEDFQKKSEDLYYEILMRE